MTDPAQEPCDSQFYVSPGCSPHLLNLTLIGVDVITVHDQSTSREGDEPRRLGWAWSNQSKGLKSRGFPEEITPVSSSVRPRPRGLPCLGAFLVGFRLA